MRDGMDGATRGATAALAPKVDQVGKWWVYAPAALATALAVLAAPAHSGRRRDSRRGRRAGAAAIAVVPALATALSPAFDRWLPQPPVGPRRRPVDHPVFPSGHAFRVTAVALAAGYVAVREGLARPGQAWPVAVAAPAAVGLARLVREKHLASDVVGGWLAGTALAALTAGAFEIARAPRRSPRWRRGR
jgi:membrane-associated phospholipid phosphatase